EERKDPRGNSYYWLKGVFRRIDNEKGSDVEAVKQGYVSITPLHLDLTNHNFLSHLIPLTLTLSPMGEGKSRYPSP
ncbi:MAG: hypothetical protein NC905_05675, partial [Candidatus Omnitrophica bacterium]|nr:hypothetical protein [Candidatus Omnitrophota bacterium]